MKTIATIASFLIAINMIGCDESDLQGNEELSQNDENSICEYTGSDEDVKNLVNLLDSCTTEKNNLKNNTKSKNGTRLKVLSYKSGDGSESSTNMYFDTLKGIICSPVKYECNNKTYCIASDSIQSTKEFDNYIWCSSQYDKFDSAIINPFGYTNVKDITFYYSNKTSGYDAFYTDPNCSNRYSYDGIFIIDKSCHYSRSDILRIYNDSTMETSKNICIDGSSFYEDHTVITSEYYTPKVSSFSTIYMYKPETDQCVNFTDSAILLKSLPDISIEQAKSNRDSYCSDYCDSLENELESFVEMKLEPI